MENPYASPESDPASRVETESTEIANSPSGSQLGRFLLHMLISSILAPAMGGAIYNYCCVDWHTAWFLPRLIGSFVGGFVLLFFIWFFTIPFGLFTCAICFCAQAVGITNRWIWSAAGALLGLLLGLWFAAWGAQPLPLLATSGSFIGLVSGLALREVWKKPT